MDDEDILLCHYPVLSLSVFQDPDHPVVVGLYLAAGQVCLE